MGLGGLWGQCLEQLSGEQMEAGWNLRWCMGMNLALQGRLVPCRALVVAAGDVSPAPELCFEPCAGSGGSSSLSAIPIKIMTRV